MGLQSLFNLFWKDLFPGSVDTGAASAQQGQSSVRLHHTPVAGDRPAHAVDYTEGAGALGLILVIAHRIGRPDSDHAGYARSRGDQLVVIVEHLASLAEHEFGGLNLDPLGHDRDSHAERLGRGKPVIQHATGHMFQQAALDLYAPHHARGNDSQQAGNVIFAWRRVQSVQHRPGETVADNGHIGRLMGIDGPQQFLGIESLALQGDHTTAGEHGAHGGQKTCAVHQRRSG